MEAVCIGGSAHGLVSPLEQQAFSVYVVTPPRGTQMGVRHSLYGRRAFLVTLVGNWSSYRFFSQVLTHLRKAYAGCQVERYMYLECHNGETFYYGIP